MVCDKMVCDKVGCVTGGRRREEAGGGGRSREAGGDPGYRIKNKNPTQSRGEKRWAGLLKNERARLVLAKAPWFGLKKVSASHMMPMKAGNAQKIMLDVIARAVLDIHPGGIWANSCGISLPAISRGNSCFPWLSEAPSFVAPSSIPRVETSVQRSKS